MSCFPACLRLLLLGGLAMTLGLSVRADQLYRCRAYGGGLFWSNTHCQQHDALVDRIETVPSGLSMERQIRVAEQGVAKSARAASRTDAMIRAEQKALQREARARERQQARCKRLDAELERQYSRSRQPLTARQQQRVTQRQQHLREERAQAGC
jgi:hypothetical protein